VRAESATILALSPELPEYSNKLIVDKGLGFEIVRDEGNALAEQFGLRQQLPEDLREVYLHFGIDLPGANGEDSWTLPMPARYVIDTGGTIRDAHVHADYTRRPEPEATLAALRAL